LYGVLCDAGFIPYLPKGSYYMITDVRRLIPFLKSKDDFDFSRKLLKVTGVATVPGFSFYADQKKNRKQVRFAFCKKWETLETVKERMRVLNN
jgi:aminotransferase